MLKPSTEANTISDSLSREIQITRGMAVNPTSSRGQACAIYLRVSTTPQATEDRMSLPTQRAQCDAYAKQQGWEVIGDEYTGDTAFLDIRSGLETEKRDAYQRLLTLARTKQIKVILVWRYDRFGRDDSELIIRSKELFRLDIKLISATEGEHQPVMFKIAAIMQFEESKRISERVKPMLMQRSEAGFWAGRVPFGYASAGPHTGLLVEDGFKAQVVQTLFQRYVEGATIHQLVRWLNTSASPDEGPLPAPQGGYWRNETVRNMLANVAYTGKRRVGWESHSKITGRFHANPNARILQSKHTPLIDEETFATVAAKLALTPRWGRPPTERLYLLTGMVNCSECGYRMYGDWTMDRRRTIARRQQTYRCRYNHFNVSTRWVDKAVLDAVASLPLTKTDIERASALFTERTSKAPDHLGELRSARGQLERRLAKATTLVLDGTLSPPIYRQQREALEAEIAAMDAELSKITAPSRQTARVLTQLSTWLEAAGDMGAILADGDLNERAEVIGGAVEKVIIHKDRVLNIVWRPWATALREEAMPP